MIPTSKPIPSPSCHIPHLNMHTCIPTYIPTQPKYPYVMHLPNLPSPNPKAIHNTPSSLNEELNPISVSKRYNTYEYLERRQRAQPSPLTNSPNPSPHPYPHHPPTTHPPSMYCTYVRARIPSSSCIHHLLVERLPLQPSNDIDQWTSQKSWKCNSSATNTCKVQNYLDGKVVKKKYRQPAQWLMTFGAPELPASLHSACAQVQCTQLH